MESLRARRPSNARKDSLPTQGQARPRPAQPRNRDARKSRVDDKIKKRMSMRYADADTMPGGAAPDVPSLPTGSRSAQVRDDPRAVDIGILEKDDFDPDTYLKIKLINSTEAELKALQGSLLTSKAATTTDLQMNIFKNYEEFITISKEISTLENDMLELKDSISEWKSMPSLLRIEDSGTTSDRRKAQRSSVADLRVLYASQLQELHANIEGSAKFVPAIPGRHVISQTPDLYHLNPATYKVEYTVHWVLLDDSVLIAKQRRRRNGERGGLVAERCWNLSEVVIVDVKDTAERTNIIKLRHGREGHVFRTDRLSEKKALLSSFRRASEELATKKRKEREGEHERRMSVWAGGADRMPFDVSTMPPLPEWANEKIRKYGDNRGGAKEKTENDTRWISDFSDNLTVAIALREWEKAVSLVEEGQKQLPTKPALNEKLTALTSSLISALLHSLSDHRNRKIAVTQLSGWLSRLQASGSARATFLASRTEVIRKRIRMIPLEGDIPLFIHYLAIIVFTAIKHTAEWYLSSFKDNDAASYLVQWSKEQMENYCVMFRKQVDSTDDERVLAQCHDITRVQSKRLLLENGMDFNFLLNDLVTSPRSSIVSRSMSAGSGTEAARTSLESNSRRAPPPRSRDRPPSNTPPARYT